MIRPNGEYSRVRTYTNPYSIYFAVCRQKYEDFSLNKCGE